MYRRLTYLSIRSPGLTDREVVESVVPSARRRNEQSGLTSCLWTNGRHFFQLLEGPQEAVIQTLARIAGDTRHSGVRIVSSERANELVFLHEPLKLVLPGLSQTDEVDRMLEELIQSLGQGRRGGTVHEAAVTPENAEHQVLLQTATTTARREPDQAAPHARNKSGTDWQSVAAPGVAAGGAETPPTAANPQRTPLVVNVLTRLTCIKGV